MNTNAAAVRTADASTDALIVGDGVIGLTAAFELVRAGVRCRILGCQRDGAASGAAAGLLAPSVGRLPARARPFFQASLRAYPELVAQLNAFEPSLRILRGLIELLSQDTSGSNIPRDGTRRSADQIAQLEPSLVAPRGARLHDQDGAVDNQVLVRALRSALNAAGLTVEAATVQSLDTRPPLAITTSGGERITGRWIVLAAGAWTPVIRGLPRPIPIEPLKGQMLSVGKPADSPALRHPVMGDDVYVVPREHETVIGATAEHAGFDLTVQDEAIRRLRRSAASFCPALAEGPILRAWAGIRPATPDMLPIIGPDPGVPNLLYACGHSKNGILLAPATASAIRDLIVGQSAADLSAFSIARFSSPRSC